MQYLRSTQGRVKKGIVVVWPTGIMAKQFFYRDLFDPCIIWLSPKIVTKNASCAKNLFIQGNFLLPCQFQDSHGRYRLRQTTDPEKAGIRNLLLSGNIGISISL